MTCLSKVENKLKTLTQMQHELLRVPGTHADLLLFETPLYSYRVEVYWRNGGYYERLAETHTEKAAYQIISAALDILRYYELDL